MRATRLLALAEPFRVVKCTKCGLRRLDPMPTDEEYRLLYEVSYFGANRSADLPSWLSEYPAVPYEDALSEARIKSYRSRLERLAALFPNRGTLLDVGMATGEFAVMAREDGWKVCGLDISEEACRLATRRNIEAHCGHISTTALTDRRFDVVHLNHVFEHFTDPKFALSKLLAFLDPQSVLVLEVPNQFDSWTRRLVNAIRLASPKKIERSVLSIHHPFFYNFNTISAMLSTGNKTQIAWCRTYFPERWSGPRYRQVLRMLDFIADKIGRRGENIEIAARLLVA